MKKTVILLTIPFSLLLLSISFAHSQAKKHSPTVDTVYSSKDQILLDYKKELNQDMIAHRSYLNDYYNKLEILTGAILAALTGFGIKGYRDMQKMIRKRINKEVDANLKSKSDQAAKNIEDLDKKSREINEKLEILFKDIADKEKAITQLEKEVSLIQDELFNDQGPKPINHIENLLITESVSMIKYLKPNGSQIEFTNEQSLSCINEIPIKFYNREFATSKPGVIMSIRSEPAPLTILSASERTYEVSINLPDLTNKDDPFKNKFTLDYFNSYLGEEEFYSLYRINEIINETFVLMCLRERVPEKILCFKVNKNTKSEELIDLPITRSSDSAYYTYSVKIPNDAPPVEFKIRWYF